ncbi:MAG: hypothetical protein JXQ73_23900 [Phycisphaerae bacterium]|nr:hypothetical protein [Phycisphaerae bacterium]
MWLILAVLVGWQSCIFLLSYVQGIARSEESDPLPSKVDQQFVASLTVPDKEAIDESAEFVEYLRRIHNHQMRVWHQRCMAFLEAPEPQRAGRDDAQAVPDDWPKLYTSPLLFAHSESTPLRAVTAVAHGCADEEILDLLACPRPHSLGAGWDSIFFVARLTVLVRVGRFVELLTELDGYEERVHGAVPTEVRKAAVALGDVPEDFDARLKLMDYLKECTCSPRFRPAHVDYCWRLMDRATNDAQRAACLTELGDLYGNLWGTHDFPTAYHFYIAGARWAHKAGDATPLQARALAALGQVDAKRGNLLRAAALYGDVVERFPATKQWGVSAFNKGWLLRKGGYPRQARDALNLLIASKVDERDPTPHIMSAYQNYRHRAAREIARSFADEYDFPMAYYWEYLATWKYPYRSWCGTCIGSARSRETWRLLTASCLAGPAFILPNLLIAPARNWHILIGLSVVVWILGRRLRRRASLSGVAPLSRTR